MTNMYALTKAYEEVQSLAENGEDVTDTLLSLEGDIEVKAENTHKVIKMFAYNNAAIDEEIKRLQEIKKHNETAVERLKTGIENMMIALNKSELKTPLFSAKWVKNPPKVVITDEKNVPAKYLTYIPATTTVNKNALKEDLKNGIELPFAHLEQGRRLDLK